MNRPEPKKRGRPPKRIKLSIPEKEPITEFKQEEISTDDLGANEEVLCETGMENHEVEAYDVEVEDVGMGSLRLGGDLNTTSKAAHYLVYKMYADSEVQDDFPFEIDTNIPGFHNFLVEPRPGLLTTDYYNDNYRWNRGSQCSTKKRVYLQVTHTGLKCIRGSPEYAHYLMHWYYSKMEKMSKRIVWLEDITKGVRCSPVLVLYLVHDNDGEVYKRKQPRLYSTVVNATTDLLKTHLPRTTVASISMGCNEDPRFIPSLTQAYSMRRRVNEKSRVNGDDSMVSDPPPVADPAAIPDEELLSQLTATFGDQRDEIAFIDVPSIMDKEIKSEAFTVCKWINSLCMATPENVEIILPHVVSKMRKHVANLAKKDKIRSSKLLRLNKELKVEESDEMPCTSSTPNLPGKRKRKPNPRYFDEPNEVILDVEGGAEDVHWHEEYIEDYDSGCDGEVALEVVVDSMPEEEEEEIVEEEVDEVDQVEELKDLSKG